MKEFTFYDTEDKYTTTAQCALHYDRGMNWFLHGFNQWTMLTEYLFMLCSTLGATE